MLLRLVVTVFTFIFLVGGSEGGTDSNSDSLEQRSDSVSSDSSSRGRGNNGGAAAEDNYCSAAGADPVPGNYPLPELEEGAPEDHTGIMQQEHMAALALVDYSQTTHAAVQDGGWCDPDTWHNKQVPGDDAHVVIPEGRLVTYGVISDARLKTLRIDGELRFSTSDSTQLIVDTLFVDRRGSLIVGTQGEPVEADQTASIMIADNGDIDTAWDPMLLSRGIVAHGRTIMHGAYKTPYLKVSVNPDAGEDTLFLEEAPVNWLSGDTLVITGTRYSGWKWNNSERRVSYHGTRDEVRSIVSINDNIVTLDSPLDYDHFTPRTDLRARVANFTRNVSFASESAGALPVHQRGHVMFMHNPDVDVRYAEFRQLGRTDKSVPSAEVEDIANVAADSNARGRYSFHLHRAGTEDQGHPAIAIGNAVFGSPGWGYVHHDSNAKFYANVSFDTFGAGFVAETGNETGAWVNNLAIKAEGNSAFNPKNGNDPGTFDIGRTGDGFWFQGRMVRSVGNVAASVNHGFVYFHRGSGMLDFPAERFMLPEALGYGREASPDDVPIRNFHNNEAFASTVGLFVVKANPDQQHDINTELTGFTAWEVRAGAAIEYTAHYLLKDFDLIGSTPEQFRQPAFGIEFGVNTADMIVNNAKIASFPDGIRLGKYHTSNNQRAVGKDQFVVIGTEFNGVAEPLVDYDASVDIVIDTPDLNPGHFVIDLDNGWQFEYLDPSTAYQAGVGYSGVKTDSIGANPLPGGGDQLETPYYDMIAILERDGYFRAANGDPYAIVEQYFSDRATGEIHKYGFKTYLGPNVESAIQNSYSAWGGAVYSGTIDLNSTPPSAQDDSAQTALGQPVSINLVANDSDVDGDPLAIDGIVQPCHGQVHDNGDGTVTYIPDFSFAGSDSFKYWVTDAQGNFTPARVTVTVNNP